MYFHGTNAELAIGELLYPGDELGLNTNGGDSSVIYLTTDEHSDRTAAVHEAYTWARTACMVAEDEYPDAYASAYVYIVEALEEVIADDHDDVAVECVKTGAAVIVGMVAVDQLEQFDTGYGDKYLNY
jgi:hypothetical protein